MRRPILLIRGTLSKYTLYLKVALCVKILAKRERCSPTASLHFDKCFYKIYVSLSTILSSILMEFKTTSNPLWSDVK